MPEAPAVEHVHGRTGAAEPRADYGLSQNDGFDPSKYDFYNPAYRTAAETVVVQLNGNTSAEKSSASSYINREPAADDIYDMETPPPLSPIEEMEDDLRGLKQRPRSDPGLPTSIELEENTNNDSNVTFVDGNEAAIDALDQRLNLLFSRQHLHLILSDSILSPQFTEFLRTYRPNSVPILAYYFDAVKALKSIKYAEAIIKRLEPIPGHDFTAEANSATMGWVLEDKADRALDVLAKDDLPSFIAYIYVRTVDEALIDRVTGKDNLKLRSIADGLAEVFVLSDPSRPDNPIVFTSEEFHKMTGYPRSEFLGRNCRTLGGPRTNQNGIVRFRTSLEAEREHCEVLLNYRKDGAPFVNLIMCVPLRDQTNKVRYYLGAQLDITDLVNECTGLSSLSKLVQRQSKRQCLVKDGDVLVEDLHEDEFEQLSQLFSRQELEKLITVRQRQRTDSVENVAEPDIGIKERDTAYRTPLVDLDSGFEINGNGSAPPLGYYKTYLLVRPYPSLRILFASPDLRTPGTLQSPLMSRIGGSNRVRNDLARALEVGRKVTAKVQWLSKTPPKSRARWIHCTPLLGVSDAIGVWMVILVDDDVEIEKKRDELPVEARQESSTASNYTSAALPWDTEVKKAQSTGVSTTIWSEAASNKGALEEGVPNPKGKKPRRPLLRQPSDVGEPGQTSTLGMPVTVRSGPKIAGKAYSFTSAHEEARLSTDEELLGNGSRPSTSESDIMVNQKSTQPKVKIAGRPSTHTEGFVKLAPINMPYRSIQSGDDGSEGGLPVRRTYKSLSPYGILFED